ncbi:response regulator transcription factor [Aerococcus urinaeequi]|uniref:response regulator transcription factor n=1 Tax=Aerococcus urinaeequi TaxID=51665 RepID=UPI003D6B9C5E
MQNAIRGDIMSSILVLEDDVNLNRGITFSLEKSGEIVFSAETIQAAKSVAVANKIDLVICDMNLPDGNGLDFIKWMKQQNKAYIICLTALDQEINQVMGYEAGADDYITKPFSLSVLLLKIEAYFNRIKSSNEENEIISRDIRVLPREMKVLVKGKEVVLTKNEWKMLTLFLKYPKQVLSKKQILENIFDIDGEFVDENTVAVNVRRLREKIEEDPAKPVYLKNIRGLGYVWNQEVG